MAPCAPHSAGLHIGMYPIMMTMSKLMKRNLKLNESLGQGSILEVANTLSNGLVFLRTIHGNQLRIYRTV